MPLRVAILSAGRGWHNEALLRALAARGHQASLLPISGMRAQIGGAPRLSSQGHSLDEQDAVLVRIIPRGSLEQTIFRMDALHLLAKRGVPVLNPASVVERTVDKLYTSALLELAGLPTPRTLVCERADDALGAFQTLGGDVVVKPLFGSMGHGLVRVDDEELAYRVFKALEVERAVYYVQQFIPSAPQGGRDLRAFVLGGRVLAAMERSSPGWRSNVARGANCRAFALTSAQEQLCLRAAEAVGAELAGVDLLESTSSEPFVLEVNGVPGWQGLQSTTALDIAAEIVLYLEDELRRGGRPRHGAQP
jgi:RimK family alpha-L-glutamate ligase